MLASMAKQTPERPQEPLKRRRGRPPKNIKFNDAFPTLTLQFQTSPDSNSPTAESNSNRMMKIGEPDAYVPLMKVSPSAPSSRKKKRKPSTVDESPTKRNRSLPAPEHTDEKELEQAVDDSLLTPMSIASTKSSNNSHVSLQVNPKTLDNLSFVTNSLPHQHVASSSKLLQNPPLVTPPHTTLKTYFPHNLAGLAGVDPSENEALAPSKLNSINEEKEKSLSFVDDGSFSFQLVVDDHGRAALSNKSPSPEKTEGKSFDLEYASSPQQDEPEMPRLVHSHTAIGIESIYQSEEAPEKPLRRKLSEPPRLATSNPASQESENFHDRFIIPQTPRSRFEFGVSSGFTPVGSSHQDHSDGELAYNLTPQFNAMMYQMMSIDSPQQKKPPHSAHSFLSPQVDLSQHSIVTSPQMTDAVDTKDIMGNESPPKSASTDEGDARTALRRAFKRK